MQDQVALAEIDQQVLASPRYGAHGASCKRADSFGHAPPQSRFAYCDGRDSAADEMSDAASRDLYFREFGHATLLLVRGIKYTYTWPLHARSFTPSACIVFGGTVPD